MGTAPRAARQMINIGPDDAPVSINDLHRRITRALGIIREPEYLPERLLDVEAATCSSDKARQLLGYRPVWSLDDGLAETIAFIRRRGPRPFEWHLPIEINHATMPSHWRPA